VGKNSSTNLYISTTSKENHNFLQSFKDALILNFSSLETNDQGNSLLKRSFSDALILINFSSSGTIS